MLKKTLAIFLVLTVAALVNGFQSSAEWVRYDSAQGRYSVLLPQQPKLASQEGTAPSGAKMTQYRATVADSNSMYSVAYFDLLPDTAYSLDKGRDGMVNAVQGTLLSEEVISLEGHPGRELKVLAKNSDYELLIRARLYEIGGRVYILQHAFLKSSDSPTVAEKTAKYFDSFKVTTSK
jgi:hypothetical protein